jgi:hypothetical protein
MPEAQEAVLSEAEAEAAEERCLPELAGLQLLPELAVLLAEGMGRLIIQEVLQQPLLYAVFSPRRIQNFQQQPQPQSVISLGALAMMPVACLEAEAEAAGIAVLYPVLRVQAALLFLAEAEAAGGTTVHKPTTVLFAVLACTGAVVGTVLQTRLLPPTGQLLPVAGEAQSSATPELAATVV